MDESTQVSSRNPDKDQADRSQGVVYRENVDESLSISHSKPTMKNLLGLMIEVGEAKANDGEGPDLLRSANDCGTSGHAATLAENRQHLANIQAYLTFLSATNSKSEFELVEIGFLFTVVPTQE
ncbi:hypothetical protein Tco_0052356 [Tanacetum coccineum]